PGAAGSGAEPVLPGHAQCAAGDARAASRRDARGGAQGELLMRFRGHDSPVGPAGARGVLLCVSLCGALLPAGAAAQAEPPTRRVKIVRTDSTRDSTVMRITINTDRIEQMIHDLMASKAMEQTIGGWLRAGGAGA